MWEFKEFWPKSDTFYGVFNYINNHYSEEEKPTATSPNHTIDLSETLYKPHSSTIAYFDRGRGDLYFDIDMKDFKIIPTHYDMETMVGTSPPVKWSIYGFNDENNAFLLDEREKMDMCENRQDYPQQCGNRAKIQFSFMNQLGPFRYIRFISHLDRYNVYISNSEYSYFRLGGFELYGQICKGPVCRIPKLTLIIFLTHLNKT